MRRERQRRILLETTFDQPLDIVWPLLSDTRRFNVVAGSGFAPYLAEDVLGPDGAVERHARKRLGPFTWRWREGFGQWVDGRYVKQTRRFENGPFKELSVVFAFTPTARGAKVTFEFLARWTSLLGDLLAATGFLNAVAAVIPKAAHKLVEQELAAGANARAAAAGGAAVGREARARIAAAVGEIEAGPYGHALAGRLAEHLLAASPIDLGRMRPLALAAAWGAPPEATVELFVAAQKAGLLAMRWEVMCPRCRGGKSQSVLLSDVPREVHCSSCNIDYGRDFASNVELVFSPSHWLRDLPEGDFCMMSPATTPHVKLQCDLAAGETRVEAIALPPGRYRLRTLEAGGEREVDLIGAGALPEFQVTAEDVALGGLAPAGSVRLSNRDDRPRSVVIETTAWSEAALTGPRVIAMPVFRDLCPEQLLRPGDDVEIDRVAILFSDLKGSTALYEAIGDSRAFALVRAHFAFLEERVRRRRGVLVKTIGDAVMAAFTDGDDALAAAIDIQQDIAAFNAGRDGRAIEIKLGLHIGPCVAVTTEGVLDYFGATVNLAARLEGEAKGGDIVVSEAIAAGPEARRALAGRNVAWERAQLAGFAEPIPFARIV